MASIKKLLSEQMGIYESFACVVRVHEKFVQTPKLYNTPYKYCITIRGRRQKRKRLIAFILASPIHKLLIVCTYCRWLIVHYPSCPFSTDNYILSV